MLAIRNMAFSAKIQWNHHLQGNVQVYNVKIPVQGVDSLSILLNHRSFRKTAPVSPGLLMAS